MPELPEVEITLRALKPHVIGKRLVDFSTDWPKSFKSGKALDGIKKDIHWCRISGLRRLGKVLFINMSGGQYVFAVHLRMSGSLLYGMPEKLILQTNKKYAHFVWKFENGQELWLRDPRKFGIVWYGKMQDLQKDKYLGSLGPDALGIPFLTFSARLDGCRGQVKALLLQQNVIAGLGNIAVDESLWEARLHPRRPVKSLSQAEKAFLHRNIQKVLRRTIKAKGNTMRDWILPDGRKGKGIFEWRVYHKTNEPCLRCGHKIKKIIVAGRATHFCPRCQQE